MNWSGPNVIPFGRKSRFGADKFILVETISLQSYKSNVIMIYIKKSCFYDDFDIMRTNAIPAISPGKERRF